MTTRPFHVVELDHLVLRVASLQASLAFYRDVLGCKLERELPELGLYQLRAGSQLIDLVPIGTKLGGDAVVRGGRNLDHFCLNGAPFDEAALREWLQAHAVVASESGRRYGAHGYGTSLYVTDPDGNTVELKAVTPVL